MAGTLISPAVHWIDSTSTSNTVVVLQLIDTGLGYYTFAQRGRIIAGSLVSDGNGGYVITLGNRTGTGHVARRPDHDDTTIF
jgi:hypothetical protein